MKLQGSFFLFMVLFCSLQILNGQSIPLSSVSVDKSSALNKIFYEYKLVKIHYDQLKTAMSTRGNEHFLHLQGAGLDWNLEMFANDIHTGNYILLLGTDHGVETLHRKPANTPMIGYLKSPRGGQARLVVAENYIAGMVEEGAAKFFIEPANAIDPALPIDYLVIYNTDNIIQNTNVLCGFDLYNKNQKLIDNQMQQIKNANRGGCFTVEIAISNDYSVFQKRGSQAAVENWNTTVLTLMGANYDNEFSTSLEFVQTASFVALSSSGDPWDGINDINSQLEKHKSWGNGGGYGGASYDVATNWSAKWLTGIIGLAWIGTVCSNYEYNCCSDYGAANSCLRQLEAHETGHNFDCNHDASGAPYIMAPAVNCSNDWSSASIAAVNAYLKSAGCLSTCFNGSEPIADFFGTPTEKCLPFTVQFTDVSTNDPTTWLWTFNGGIPSSSNLQNPTAIQYKSYGMYDVILEVTNSYGSSTKTFKQYIYAKDKPVTDFSRAIVEKLVYFTNLTLYGASYDWDFGDGEISNDVDPIHQYAKDGIYTVILRAENDCGTVTTKQKITIVTIPIASFVADTIIGCDSFKVKYTNLSSKNVVSWAWEFPGGTPSISSQFEPTVEYKNHGVFDVKLTAINSKYKATSEKLKYIIADSIPIAVFDTLVNKNVVNFTNKTADAKSWLWDFGDGTTSTDLNPSHTYTSGTYQVKLTVSNLCGTNTIIKNVTVFLIPQVDFESDTTLLCGSGYIQFKSKSSSDVHSWSWQFDGGKPDISDEKNPMVYYEKKGVYNVNLIVQNSNGENKLLKQSYIKVISTVLCPESVYYKNADLNEVITDPLKRYQSENPMVYPNPFNGILSIHGNSESYQIQLRIFNLLGREVYQELIPVTCGHYNREMNLDYLKEGTYYINLRGTKENATQTVFLSK